MFHDATPADSPSLADPQVFAAHYLTAYRRVVLIAAGVTGDRTAAEDVVQDAAIIAFRKAHEFDGRNFAAWLAEIVRRCALNHRRRTASRRAINADPATLAASQAARPEAAETRFSAAGADAHAANHDELFHTFDDRTLAALQSLTPEARACLLLRVVDELSYAEIAELMNMPEGTAMSHVHRSKQALRRQLSPTSATEQAASRE